jgi:alanine racemase
MNRFGFKTDADKIKDALSSFSGEIEGVYTHFHGADCRDISVTESELDAFLKKSCELEALFNKKLFRHAAASACALRITRSRLDACRIGLALYGIAPENCVDIGLVPVMTFSAPIVSLKNVKKGENIGYGCDRYAENDMLIAIVSAGYGNGLPRFLYGRFSPELNGYPVPFVGRICMDRCMLNVTELRGLVGIGDEINFFGPGRRVNCMSDAEMTVPYETLVRIGMMNKKEFFERRGRNVGCF